MNTTTTRRWVLTGAVAMMATAGVAACSDDDTAKPAATTTAATAAPESVEEFGARIQTECPGGDPGFDTFLGEHPEPTAADWAGFLPEPLQMLTQMRDCIAASNPPAEVADEVDGVVAAFDVVITDFEKALAAADAGDLDTTNQWITQMHDVDQPKIDEAVAAVGVG